MEKLLLIALGGGAGSMFRYLLAGWVQSPRVTGTAVFPLGTLVVNVVGSLLIGVLAAMFFPPSRLQIDEKYRIALMIGLLGGFTTFSTFSYETFELMRDSQWARAGLNILLTNVLCLGVVWVGFRLTSRFIGA